LNTTQPYGLPEQREIMKNIRHINIRNTAIAIVAVAGVAVAITACSRNSSTDSASKALETTIETVADQSESEAKIQSPAAVSSVSGKVGSPAASSSAPSTATPLTDSPSTDSPSTDTPASAEVDPILESAGTETDPSIETEETPAEPSAESPATATPDTATPDTTTPDTTTPASASPTIPGIVLSPTISFVTFAQDGVTINTSILVEEAGLGRNDIVSVEFTYTKFGTERTVTATKASSTTTSSLWLVESLMLPVGSTVKIHAVDARGNSDDITKTVVLSTAMG
jgi:hypothetical protein